MSLPSTLKQLQHAVIGFRCADQALLDRGIERDALMALQLGDQILRRDNPPAINDLHIDESSPYRPSGESHSQRSEGG